jgi:hypothetical protein
MQGRQRPLGTDANCGEATLCKLTKVQFLLTRFQPAHEKEQRPGGAQAGQEHQQQHHAWRYRRQSGRATQ